MRRATVAAAPLRTGRASEEALAAARAPPADRDRATPDLRTAGPTSTTMPRALEGAAREERAPRKRTLPTIGMRPSSTAGVARRTTREVAVEQRAAREGR